MPFELNAKNFFLTYPRCPITPDDALEHIRSLPCVGIRPFHHCIARERHQDGSYHLHVILSFRRSLHLRNADAFDLEHEGETYHPNCQRPRNLSDVLEYAIKDGDFISDHPKLQSEESWGSILETSQNPSEFLTRISQKYPRDYCLSYERLLAFAESRWRKETPLYEPRFRHFRLPDELLEWRENNLDVSIQ